MYILQQSIKVSLIAVSVEQLIYLLLTRNCLTEKVRVTGGSMCKVWVL